VTDLEPHRPSGLDRFTVQGRTVVRRLREVEGEAIVRARAIGLAEDLALMQAQMRAAGSGELFRAVGREMVRADALISAVSEGKPGVELALRKLEEMHQLGLMELLVKYETRS
jgi:hypothetical protein